MRTDMRGKDFVTLMDFTGEEIETILEVGFDLKRQNAVGAEHELLKNKTLGMIFAQPAAGRADPLGLHPAEEGVFHAGHVARTVAGRTGGEGVGRAMDDCFDRIAIHGNHPPFLPEPAIFRQPLSSAWLGRRSGPVP